MAEIETVKIKHPTRAFAIINKSDFDPKEHELFDKKPQPKKKGDK